jgi:hypothetical protein
VQDRAFVGNIVAAMAAYATGALGEVPIRLSEVDRLIVIGSDGMMRGVQEARHTVLKPYLKEGPPGDRQHQLADAVHDEGDLRPVPAGAPRPAHRQGGRGLLLLEPGPAARPRPVRQPAARLSQNGVQEKLTKLWIDHCLRQLGVRPANGTPPKAGVPASAAAGTLSVTATLPQVVG